MRRIRFVVQALLAAALVLVGIANMTPVELRLLPPLIAGNRYVISGVPLAIVILAAVLAGIILGQVIEYFREWRQRRQVEEKRREIAELRREVERLRSELGDRLDDLPRIPA